MYCQVCGTAVPEGGNHCPNCGAAVKDLPRQEPAVVVKNVLPKENKPLSPWAYFGLQLLFAIPLIGFVCLIAFSFNPNVNVKNYARSIWCGLLVFIVVMLILYFTGVSQEVLQSVTDFYSHL